LSASEATAAIRCFCSCGCWRESVASVLRGPISSSTRPGRSSSWAMAAEKRTGSRRWRDQ